jgi:hypothetical protein
MNRETPERSPAGSPTVEAEVALVSAARAGAPRFGAGAESAVSGGSLSITFPMEFFWLNPGSGIVAESVSPCSTSDPVGQTVTQ